MSSKIERPATDWSGVRISLFILFAAAGVAVVCQLIGHAELGAGVLAGAAWANFARSLLA